jgi:redox-sensitive bicupin YhaK (pirin superfamily)
MPLIDLTIEPREKNIGGLTVRRLLPYASRRMVGPFIFLDHFGPASYAPGEGMDVRPHPHIGLATVTYLFEGEAIHRDTLGSHQAIRPGDVNWMTAGSGIAHSERTGKDERGRPHRLHGLQSWVALPKEYEESPPEFFHHPAATLPQFGLPGVLVRLIAGRAYGQESPAKTLSPLFYAAVTMEPGSRFVLPGEYRERALMLLEGAVRIGGTQIAPGTMPVFPAKQQIIIEAQAPSRLVLLGGDPFPEPRYIDWNFVSSDKERIEQAKADWRAQRFGTIPGDDSEFIPLPEQERAKEGSIL